MNAETLLLVVHPGSHIHVREDPRYNYGSYSSYLSRLVAAVQSYDSIILRDKTHDPPFKLRSGAKIIPDTDGHYGLEDVMPLLVPLLRGCDYERIDVCGEFLWAYVQDAGKSTNEYAEKLPQKKQAPFEHMMDTSRWLSRKKFEDIGLDYDEFMRAAEKTTGVVDCCVRHVYNMLAADFPVEIRRELCYPETEPPPEFTFPTRSPASAPRTAP